jgi:conjugative relaxase-like TrwC/TraI family protein
MLGGLYFLLLAFYDTRILTKLSSKQYTLPNMIRMIQSNSSGHAKGYFKDALLRSDYYIDNQELPGKFEGKLAQRLGLPEMANQSDFFNLCENINPKTGENLTPRTKEGRRIGYDINFHSPKSLSLLHSLSNDDHLLKAFEEAVSATMQDIEIDSKTRVRKGGQFSERETGELVWASFTHQTARPVDGHTPDPHLHTHCFVFNATWDDVEQEIKAGEFGGIKRDMPYYQSLFHKRLADKLVDLGYQVRRTDKMFEIEGVPKKILNLFSKRTNEIGQVAAERGITDEKEKSELGARTRNKKQKGLSMAELKEDWKKQIQAIELDEAEGNVAIRFSKEKRMERTDALEPVNHAIQHAFERASVMSDRKILKQAFRYSLGDSKVSIDAIIDEFKKDSRILRVRENSTMMCTTKEVLGEEQKMVELARSGFGQVIPLYQHAPYMDLKGQQLDAVNHVLTTSNRVSIIRGAAGSGKTTLMKEAVSQMERKGKKVTVVAPTAEASRGVLFEEGFSEANTVAKLLSDKTMQDAIQGQILWVDEAGLLGTKDMTALLNLTKEKDARLILGGDTRQHSSVVRGDALRILNMVAGIQSAEVSKIYRQKYVDYRQAVEFLSKGEIRKGFDKLDEMESIIGVDPMNPHEKLVNDYVDAVKKGKSALVVSPTHKQGEEVTDALRKKLREADLLGKKELKALRLVNTNLTEAQKSDWKNFREGQVIQFKQHLPFIKRGSVWDINAIENGNVRLINRDKVRMDLPLDKASHFDAFDKSFIELSKGDKIAITRNGQDSKKKRLNNGQNLEIVSVSKSGEIVLESIQNKATFKINKDFGHLTHAHVITSHASQGKTVDEVFIAQPAATFPATDAKQFYVSVSRGRERARIYTDDKEALLDYASDTGDRQSAMELLGAKEKHLEQVIRKDRETRENTIPTPAKAEPNFNNSRNYDLDHEPGI